jgi:hypothetical protein
MNKNTKLLVGLGVGVVAAIVIYNNYQKSGSWLGASGQKRKRSKFGSFLSKILPGKKIIESKNINIKNVDNKMLPIKNLKTFSPFK